MKIVTGALLPLLGAALVLAAVPLSSVQWESSFPFVANRFIVEFASVSDIPSKRSLSSPHEVLYQSLRARGVGFQVDKEYHEQSIFIGAALTLTNEQDVAKLQAIPGIVAIRPITIMAAPKPVNFHILSGPSDPQLPHNTESTHIVTGVKQLHAEGNIGKDVKIGVIDTGIDYTQPLLGGKFGPGNKVAGGLDLVGNKFDGTNKPVPKDDPMDCDGHGTHVAGIIAADPDNLFNISGVAYGATLSAYKIFGCTGVSRDDVIVHALLLAFKDGQDILTLSVGSANGWTESTSAVVASRIAQAGRIVTVAAGNDGPLGSWYTSSPGTGLKVISVASVNTNQVSVQSATVNGPGVTHGPITYFDIFPLPITGNLPIFALSTDVNVLDDGCSPLPDNTPDLSPFLVVVRQGFCSLNTKIANVATKGAKVAFLYNDGTTRLIPMPKGKVAAATISKADGEFLVSQFAIKANITVSFPQTGANVLFDDSWGGLVSNFSSYGPSYDLFLKPAIAAPGCDIVSTYPVRLGSYALMSGTSMATPYMAGSAALLISAKGKTSGVRARSIFETTAQMIPSSHADGAPLQTLTQQGAGMVNVHNAIHATTIVSPGEFLLNDTNHFQGEKPFRVRNTGSTAQTYTLSHVPAGTAVTVTPFSIFAAPGPVPLSTQYATVKFSETSFTVQPGKTYKAVASFSPPAGLDASTLPVYSGIVQIKSDTECLQIPYMGLAATLKDKKVLDNTNTYFNVPLPELVDPSGKTQLGARTYSFVGNDYPRLLFRLAFGTALLRVDLVDYNTKIAATLNTRDLSEPGLFLSYPHGNKHDGSFAQVPTRGQISEMDYVPRNSYSPSDNGYYTIKMTSPTFGNGTWIPNGSYRFLLRVLRVEGDPTNEDDFESFLSPIVRISIGG